MYIKIMENQKMLIILLNMEILQSRCRKLLSCTIFVALHVVYVELIVKDVIIFSRETSDHMRTSIRKKWDRTPLGAWEVFHLDARATTFRNMGSMRGKKKNSVKTLISRLPFYLNFLNILFDFSGTSWVINSLIYWYF